MPRHDDTYSYAESWSTRQHDHAYHVAFGKNVAAEAAAAAHEQ